MTASSLNLSGITVILDPLTGVGGLKMPDPALDLPDPSPETAASMHEAMVSSAFQKLVSMGWEPHVWDFDEWVFLDDAERVLSLLLRALGVEA